VTALSFYNSFDKHGWLDDFPSQDRSKLTIVRGDIRDSAFVRRIIRDQEIVFHLAALISIPQSYVAAESYVQTNVLGTINVLEAAREFGIGRVIHTSSSEVYGTALSMPISESHPLQGQSPYSASKIGADMMAEAFARSFNSPVVILRPFNTYGPRQSERAIVPTIIRQILDPNCPAILVGDTTPVRDLTFVDDTAAAFLAAGTAPNIEFGRPYNAGTGDAVTIAQLIELIQELIGCCGKPVVQDDQRLRPPNSEVRSLLASSARLAEHTGWRANIGLAEGLSRTISWWRSRFESKLVRTETSYIF
jgi:UDP-glucose 4-epimerase